MSGKWIAGVDLGGTTTKLAFITDNGEIVWKWEIPTDNVDQGMHITANIAKAIDQKLEEHGILKDQLIGIGMGAPGPIDYSKGIILNAVNLGWKDHFPLRDSIADATSLPAVVENDANCAALGERWKGAGNGAKDLVCITLGTGVGGGIIANGEIVQGMNGAGGEIGHITAIPSGGAPCNCGKSGCLETVASATGIVRLALSELETGNTGGMLQKLFVQNKSITAKNVLDCAREGDPLAQKVVGEVSFYLGLALANIANTLNPEKIVLGGGVANAGDVLLNPVKKQFAKFAFTPAKSTPITLATLGNDAGVIGAAWLMKKQAEQMNHGQV